jgi:hypothetical protein
MSKKAVIIIIVLLLLCCCITVLTGMGGYWWYTTQSKSNSSDTITASVTPTLFSTTKPTSTPEVSSIKTVVDTFDVNINGWTLDKNDTEYAYSEEYMENGKLGFYVEAKKAVLVWDVLDSPKATDFEVSVDGKKISGDKAGDYALIFRKVDANNYYVFIVNEDYQEYELAVRKDGEWKTLVQWTESKNIIIGKVNKLKVNVVGSTIKAYINNQLETTITDTSITGEGYVGVAVDLYATDQVGTFEFDNFSLKKIK